MSFLFTFLRGTVCLRVLMTAQSTQTGWKNVHTHTRQHFCVLATQQFRARKGEKRFYCGVEKREKFPLARKTLNKSWVEQQQQQQQQTSRNNINLRAKSGLENLPPCGNCAWKWGSHRGSGGNGPGNCPGIVLVPVISHWKQKST